MGKVQITRYVLVLLQVFLEDVHQQRYGYELMKFTGFPSGKLYPMLAKLQAAGWLESEMEVIDPVAERRPPRRWYCLSESGVAKARYEVAAARQQLEPRQAPGCGKLRPLGGEA